jgi:hypothetical protein
MSGAGKDLLRFRRQRLGAVQPGRVRHAPDELIRRITVLRQAIYGSAPVHVVQRTTAAITKHDDRRVDTLLAYRAENPAVVVVRQLRVDDGTVVQPTRQRIERDVTVADVLDLTGKTGRAE